MKIIRLLVVSASVFFSQFAGAQSQDPGYAAASDQFNQLIARGVESGKMPLVSEKKAASLIATLSDTKRFLHSRKFTQDDMEYLLDMCGRANNAVMAYVLFDGRRNVKPGSTRAQTTEQVVKNMNENVLAYQSEIESLMPYLLHCLATQVPILTKFVDGLKPEELTNIRREGLTKMRKGVFRTYTGFIEMVGNPQARRSLREKVFAALADTSPEFSSVFSVVDRTQVLRLIKTLDPKQPEFVKTAIDRITVSMQNKDCFALCKF
jgi:hypothetical protein